MIGRHPREYGTQPLRRTGATLVYGRTKNLRAVQLLLDRTPANPYRFTRAA
jgi:hypothetical protein